MVIHTAGKDVRVRRSCSERVDVMSARSAAALKWRTNVLFVVRLLPSALATANPLREFGVWLWFYRRPLTVCENWTGRVGRHPWNMVYNPVKSVPFATHVGAMH